MVRIEGVTYAIPGEMGFSVVTPLFCEDGHREDALNTVFVNLKAGTYYIITGDDWWFADCCDPCGNEDCHISCDQCEKGF